MSWCYLANAQDQLVSVYKIKEAAHHMSPQFIIYIIPPDLFLSMTSLWPASLFLFFFKEEDDFGDMGCALHQWDVPCGPGRSYLKQLGGELIKTRLICSYLMIAVNHEVSQCFCQAKMLMDVWIFFFFLF